MKIILTKQQATTERDNAIALAHKRYSQRLYEIDQIERRKKEPAPTPKSERAWLLRNDGLAFRDIAEKLGVSTQRASQLVRKHEWSLQIKKSDPLGSLTERARNCLKNSGINEPEHIAALGYKGLSKLPNLGKKSIVEIAIWLKDEQGLDLAD